MCGRGLTERHALKVIGMSASSVRYRPAPDRNAELRKTIIALAHRHRRYGAGMIDLGSANGVGSRFRPLFAFRPNREWTRLARRKSPASYGLRCHGSRFIHANEAARQCVCRSVSARRNRDQIREWVPSKNGGFFVCLRTAHQGRYLTCHRC